jgi:hypothetical protein
MKRAWILAAALLLAACATTQLRDSWKDPAFSGPPMKRVMVVGVLKSDSNRRVFEDAFSQALAASGTSAVASYTKLPEGGTIANERVEAAVKDLGADAVLVTKVLRVKREVDVQPAYVHAGFYGTGFRGYYGGSYAALPPSVDVYDVLTVESTLWNMRTDKPVWSGTSEVTEPKVVSTATAELAKVLIAKMKADGVI